MKNTFGNSFCVTLFGESHGQAIGAVLDGLKPGEEIDLQKISALLKMRKGAAAFSTKRNEKDEFKIVSGFFEGKTTGTPLCILIENNDTKSADYSKMKSVARPSHADYT
ncbi:MAG: chorismate synthase, partial [Clostridia bacterium]|nr:chorismate synthase [Clostridia bacterium]